MTRFLLISFLLALLITSGFQSFSQTSDEQYYQDESGRDAIFKPRIGVGAGIFTFFGDVHDNNYNHPFTSSLGYEFVASSNLNRYFNLDLKAFYGNIKVNERGASVDGTQLKRNLNFKSEVFVGGASVSYNFNHLYNRPGIIQPFVSLGVAFITFDTKGDLLDSRGNQYHYWSNGDIKDIAENDPLSDAAVIIQRDYNYETDLRQSNLDSLGKYATSSMAIPFSAGLDFRLSKRMSAKFSTTLYYTFTDQIDNVSDAGSGVRKGNSANDMFLFTSMSVSYAFGLGGNKVKENKSKYFNEHNFTALYFEDSDGDGVNDFDDMCAYTPEGAKVDEFGCAIDTDVDDIQNYRDDEAATPQGSVVTTRGVALTDSMMLAAYIDSVALKRSLIPIIYPSGVLSINPPLSKEDSIKLVETKKNLRLEIESNGDLDQVFQSIEDEVLKMDYSGATSAEEVYIKADQVYNQLVDDKIIEPTAPLAITTEPARPSIIPPEYVDADYNNDGILTSDEVLRVIDAVLDGSKTFTVAQVYGLIDYATEYMENTRVVDFGGTMGVYIDNTLHILDNYDDGRSDTEKYLAKKYNAIDTNGDGVLSPDEVNSMIARFQNGDKTYTEEDIYTLIDLYFED